MTKAQKKSLGQLLTALLVIFITLVIVVPLLTVGVDASDGWINFVDFFSDIKTSISEDVSFYALVVGILFVLWLVFKGKLKKLF
jgi:ABC-type sulfate transport system permease component